MVLLGWDREVLVVWDENFEISVIGKEAGVTLGRGEQGRSTGG